LNILWELTEQLPQIAISQLSDHSSQGFGWISRLADWTTDHQIIRTRIQRLARSQNTALVIQSAAGWTNTRGYQFQSRVGRFQRLRLQSGTHQPIHPGLLRQGCQAQHLLLRLDIQANGGKVFALHAGQHSDANQQRLRATTLVEHFAAGSHHAQTARTVNVNHPHAHFSSSFNRHCCGIGNIVELEIQEHLEAFVTQSADNFRSTAGEQLFAHFHAAQLGVQLISQFQCGVTRWEIQGDDNRSLAVGH